MTIDNIKKSLNLALYERVSNPVSGSIIVSWFVINWKIVLSIFLTNPKEFGGLTKIKFIESQLNWYSGLLFPLLSGLFFILLYPILVKGITKIWLQQKQAQLEQQKKIEGTKLVSKDDMTRLNDKIERQEKVHVDELAFRDERIKTLEKKNSELYVQIQNVLNNKEIKLTNPLSAPNFLTNGQTTKVLRGQLVEQLDTDGSAGELLAEILTLKESVTPKNKTRKKKQKWKDF